MAKKPKPGPIDPLTGGRFEDEDTHRVFEESFKKNEEMLRRLAKL